VEGSEAEKELAAGGDDGGRKVGTGCATDGRGGGGETGRGTPPFDGGRAGKLIRTVSRGLETGGTLADVRGGKVMRTVSFLGSFGSAIFAVLLS